MLLIEPLLELKPQRIFIYLAIYESFNRTTFGIETFCRGSDVVHNTLLLIEPLLELKQINYNIFYKFFWTFNRTTFGIETANQFRLINRYRPFNRTTFGIETG